MAENSKIQWTNHTLNPWRGCTKVAPGCTNCYAERDAKRFPKLRGIWGPDGSRVMASAEMWRQPLKWNRAAEAAGVRARVFCASLADVFEDWQGPIVDSDEEILARCDSCGLISPDGLLCEHCRKQTTSSPVTMADLRRDLFALIDKTPWLDWLLLTKRPENIRRMWPLCAGHPDDIARGGDGQTFSYYRPNAWLLTSISDQATAEANLPPLLGCRDLVPVLGVSAEPLLAGVDLCKTRYAPKGFSQDREPSFLSQLDWVIIGCESGHGRRPMPDGAAEQLLDQCQAGGVAAFMKQMEVDGAVTGDLERFPPRLRVRQYPETKAVPV